MYSYAPLYKFQLLKPAFTYSYARLYKHKLLPYIYDSIWQLVLYFYIVAPSLGLVLTCSLPVHGCCLGQIPFGNTWQFFAKKYIMYPSEFVCGNHHSTTSTQKFLALPSNMLLENPQIFFFFSQDNRTRGNVRHPLSLSDTQPSHP